MPTPLGIVTGGYSNLDGFISDLEIQNIFASDWVLDVYSRVGLSDFGAEMVYSITLSDIGITSATKLEKIYDELHLHGYTYVSVSCALRLYPLLRDSQAVGRWVCVATEPGKLIDADGIPHLLKYGFGLQKARLETYFAWPSSIFHPHNTFIVKKK